jgi:3-hydroxyacyl-[acyl-carrier-protein] dehydratase
MSEIDQSLIKKYLVHRYPFLYIDKLLDINLDDMTSRALKNVTHNEHFFQGHFPGNPVMPGVIMLEAMCQTSLLTAQHHLMETKGELSGLFFLAGFDKVKFKRIVVPGDQLIFESKFIKHKQGKLFYSECQAYVDGELVCSALIKAATANNITV